MLLSDVSTDVSSTNGLPALIVTAVAAPVVVTLGLFVRWAMKTVDALRMELSEAYKTTIPVVQQSLASQREMVDVTKAMADLLAQERYRNGGRR